MNSPFAVGQLVMVVGGEPSLMGQSTRILSQLVYGPIGWVHQIAAMPTKNGLAYYFQSKHLMPIEPTPGVVRELLKETT